MTSGKKKGSQIVIDSLIEAGVEQIFGFPGGAVIPIYDVLYDAPLKHILAATSRAPPMPPTATPGPQGRWGSASPPRVPGRPTWSPGCSRRKWIPSPWLPSPDRSPWRPSAMTASRRRIFTESGIPVTKYNYLVKNVEDLQRVIKEASSLPARGEGCRLGGHPEGHTDHEVKPKKLGPWEIPGYLEPFQEDNSRQIAEAPPGDSSAPGGAVVYGGDGVVSSGAVEELRTFIQKTRIPSPRPLMGKAYIPSGTSSPSACWAYARDQVRNYSIYESDLIIAMA